MGKKSNAAGVIAIIVIAVLAVAYIWWVTL
jgi:hypothetical protein